MSKGRELEREIEALRERNSTLSTAILRISASLDVTTVLQEAVDSARAITAAGYGFVATSDATESFQEVVSYGFSAE